MKKLVSFLVLALLAIPSLTFSATTHDMLEDKWYYSNTFKSEGNDVYAKLTNREDLYDGTNYSGDGKAQLRHIKFGYDDTICTDIKIKMKAKDYAKCTKKDPNQNWTFQARGMYTKIYNDEGVVKKGLSVYSRVE